MSESIHIHPVHQYRIDQWKPRAERFVVALEARIKALDGEIYTGCGSHYAKYEELAHVRRLLAKLEAVRGRDEIARRIVTKVVLNSLAKEVALAERDVQERADAEETAHIRMGM